MTNLSLPRPRRRLRSAAVVAAVTAIALAGCSSNSGGTIPEAGVADSVSVGFIGPRPDGGTPVDGGSLTFGSFHLPDTLDPTASLINGAKGATEFTAIYDTLLRVDPQTGEYRPQLAEGLEVSDDHTRFTLRLRPDATFSDSTPVDAAAVAWSLQRYVDAGMDMAGVVASALQEIAVVDEHTVEIILQRPWARFPALLATGPGMIVAPTSVDGEEFTPIGAGPFTLTRLDIGESMLVAAREDYHGGRPHLDTVEFVQSGGPQAQLDNLNSGQFDMTYMLQDGPVIEETIADGYAGYLDYQGLGFVLLASTADDAPGADPRVRRAIAHGVDREVFRERALGGVGTVAGELIPPGSRWEPGVPALPYDPELAAELLEQARADGFDGRLELLTPTTPFNMEGALALQTSLKSIGFDVDLVTSASTVDATRRVFADRDFEIYRGAFAAMDELPSLRLYGSMHSASPNNPQGYADPRMDEFIVELQAAADDAEINRILGRIQELANETVPYVVLGPMPVYTAWNSTVHGIERNLDNSWLLEGAWLD